MGLLKKMSKINGAIRIGMTRVVLCVDSAKATLLRKMDSQRGQGTTEYAILVGVLVVIAILAIVAFKPALENLWTSIQDNINKLG
jgi:Flp pilus assembly pilin Flp